MKTISVTLHSDQLPAAHAYHSTQAEGSSLTVALARGLGELLKRDHVKGRRLREFTLRVEVLRDEKVTA